MSKNDATGATGAPEFLTDKQAAALLNLGATRFFEVQRLPGFPAPVWFGIRGKRHVRGKLIAWALEQTEEPPQIAARAARHAAHPASGAAA